MQEDKIHSVDADHLEHKEFRPMMDKFVAFVSDKLNLKKLPTFVYKKLDTSKVTSFGGYDPAKKEITISTKDRHPMDVFRTVAHELVHHKQNEDGRINDPRKEGETGSEIEDEANFLAGRLMRWYGKANPEYFKLPYVVENTAIFVVGGPCCGKDRLIKEIMETYEYDEIDIQALDKAKEISESIIINASADKYDEIIKAKQLLEYNDYNVSMIFVDVADDISRTRNEQRAARGQRVLNESVRSAKYLQAKQNLERFDEAFDEVFEIENNMTEQCWAGYRRVKGRAPYSKGSCVKVSENLHQWFQSRSPKTGARGWVQVGGKYDGYPCARQKGQSSTPKCRSSEERSKMSKKEKNYAFKKKNREDPNQPEKSGGAKPTMVKTYKEYVEMQEEKDACYHKVKSRYDVFPSAYASGALVKCRKVGAANWGNKSKKMDEASGGKDELAERISDLRGVLDASPENKGHPAYKHLKAAEQSVESNDVIKAIAHIKDAMDVMQSQKPKEKHKHEPPELEETKGSGSGLGRELRSVDKDFASYMAEEHGAGFWGTTELANKYKQDTPGQMPEEKHEHTKDCGCMHEKKKIVRKKVLAQEDGILDNAAGTVGLIPGTEAGPGNFYSYAKVPGLMTGLGTGYSFPFGTLGESVANWFNDPKTQERFKAKYGTLAEQKLIEAAMKLNKTETKKVKVKGRKPFSKIREGLGLGYSDMATIPGQKWKDDQSVNEEGEPKPKVPQKQRYGEHRQFVVNVINKHRGEYDPVATPDNLHGFARRKIHGFLRKELQDTKPEHIPIIKKLLHTGHPILKKKELDEGDTWHHVKYQNPKGGLTKAGVMKYRQEHPGSKLQTAVREKPSKLKKGGKRWKRRKSFCSRMKGMKRKLTSAKTARDPNSRINKSLRAWNCEE